MPDINNANDLLNDGFEFVPTDGIPFITLDSQRRFYINATVRKLLGIRPYMRLILAYRPLDHSLAIVLPDAVTDVNATVASYFVDKRFYMSARKFCEQYTYDVEKGPFTFVYDRGSSDGNVFIFRRAAE